MTDDIPEFGARVAGAEYILRPGGYAVVSNADGEIAIARTPKGYFLPGGGQETDETLEQAAVRETFEECGLRIEVTGHIGTADELVFKASQNTYYRKRCTFFSARVVGHDGEGEADHQLMWMPPKQAATMLSHQSQVWAVSG